MAIAPLLLVALSLASLSESVVVPHIQPNGTVSMTSESTQGSGILKLEVTKVNKTINAAPRWRRQSEADLGNPALGSLYLIDINVGTPGQSVKVQLDTGSSDLWVDPECSTSAWSSFCNQQGTYQTKLSSTAVDDKQKMSITYGSGNVQGEYYSDTVSIGGATLQHQQLGVAATSSYVYTGIMGVSWGKGLGTTYPNIIDQLAAQGVTKSRAFSVDLGSVSTADGSIIFGGIDTKKYSGPLGKSAIIPYKSAPDGFPRYWIYNNAISMTRVGSGSKTYSSSQLALILDTGSTLSSLPTSIVTAMIAGFSGAVSQGGGLYTVPCSYQSEASYVDFTFGSTIIHVPFSQFIWNSGSQCYFGAQATNSNLVILGDTFLRAAYVVFDQDNSNILMAPQASCGSNIVAIGSGPNAVPSSVGGCAPTYTAPANTVKSSSTSTHPTTSSTHSTSHSTTTSHTTSHSTTLSTSTHHSSSSAAAAGGAGQKTVTVTLYVAAQAATVTTTVTKYSRR